MRAPTHTGRARGEHLWFSTCAIVAHSIRGDGRPEEELAAVLTTLEIEEACYERGFMF